MPIGDGIRRNVANISQEERNRLRDAFIALNHRFYPGGRNDSPPGGVSYWFKQDEIHQATHVHSFPPYRGIAFLTWHRELCNRLEALLREVDPALSLHYWDWTTDPLHSPDGKGGFVNLFTPDFMGSANGSAGEPWLSAGFYNPTVGSDRDSTGNPVDPPLTLVRQVVGGIPNLGTSDAQILAAVTYPDMRQLLEGAHGAAHGYIGGTLNNPHISFRDPIVFLLHSNVDRLFAMWQCQLGKEWRLDPELVYGSESNTDVVPGATIYDPGILTLLDPWAGNPNNSPAVQNIRPWAAPENEQLLPENQKNSKHPTVVALPDYDSCMRVHLPTKNSSFMTQGRFGRRGNFEMVVPRSSGGLAHFWRDNDAPELPWNGPIPFGSSDTYAAVTLIQSNFTSSGNGAGNLEVVARSGNRLDFYWRDDVAPFTWHGPIAFETGVAGTHGLIQGNFGVMGNFEMVVPLAAGGLAHFWRDNDAPGLPWNGPIPFGSSDTYASVALIQSNFTSSGNGAGNLEVVARSGNRLDFYWRDDVAPFTWHGPIAFETGVTGDPTFIQSRFGRMGNFEMVVPLAAGGLAHFWRDNDAPGLPWNGPIPFGSSDTYAAVTLIQSNFSSSGNGPGNLEVVARSGNRLDFYWRDDATSFTWHGPIPFATI